MRHLELGGVVVEGVVPGSPAASAGLEPGDRLLTVGEESIQRPTDVQVALGAFGPGQSVKVTVQRRGQQRFMRVQLVSTPDPSELMRALYVGKPAPSITALQTVQGAVVPSLTRLQGQIVVLEFWATWCVACRALGPTLNRWHDELGARGVSVLAATTEPHDEVASAIPQLAMRYPVFVDPEGEVTMAYRANALPTMFLIDGQGVVREVIVGFDPHAVEVFREKLAALIQRPR